MALRLGTAGCLAAAEEAAELVGTAPDEPTLEAWLRRREDGEPLAWITSAVVFCGQRLHVAPGVYVPRPQTEELARRAASLLPDNGRAVDLCTGAGAVAAHLKSRVPAATVVGVDIDVKAAACARLNGVTAVLADLAAPLRQVNTFDLVTAVAPYVPTRDLQFLPGDAKRHEPLLALDGGADGLVVLRRAVRAAGRLLRPGGWLLAELGGSQDEALAGALELAGLRVVSAWRDEDGDLRGIACQAAVREP